MKHCQETNFKSPDCQKIKCGGDSTIELTSGDEDDCGINVDPQSVKNILLPCDTTNKPVGADMDPCKVIITATGFDQCEDPNAPIEMHDPGAGPQQPQKGCPVTVVSLPASVLGIGTTGPCPPSESGVITTGCTIGSKY